MKKINRIVIMLVVATMMLPTVAFAKGHIPYKDVTRRKVDAKSYTAIVFVKEHHGWVDIARKGRLKPNKTLTYQDLITVLDDLYPGKLPVSMDDLRNWRKKADSVVVCNKLAELSAALGYKISWSGVKSSKMKRKDLARYIMIFATYNPALMPIR